MRPQSISGLGKIYDFVAQEHFQFGSSEMIYYVIHSRLNLPVRISRCYLSQSQFVCGDPDSPISTTSFGYQLIRNTDAPSSAKSVFSNVTVNEAESTRINFNDNTPNNYGAGQNGTGTVSVSPDGSSLTLDGNRWQYINFPYTITANTVLEFDFSSSVEGEIHGIGFDTNLNVDSNLFQLHGSEIWGIQDFNNYAGAGTPQHYTIPVGQFYTTGDFNYLYFAMDDDETESQSVVAEEYIFHGNCEGNSVPGFVLRPSDPNGDAIISIHGGPNEAWDGRFSQVDYVLAQKGYTVYMPNPAGSTGYGKDHTEKGHEAWGTNIYQDIVCVVVHIDSSEENIGNLYLMGFSFGGYIANWIQTEPNNQISDKLDALIAFSAPFDLRTFSESTDQFWFPQFQLGCSGDICTGADYNCDDRLCSHSGTLPVVSQNPACFVRCRWNKINTTPLPTPLPILIFAGLTDHRVPFCDNTPSMINSYRDNGVPFTFKFEAFQDHGYMPHTRIEQGHTVHNWIETLKVNSNENACNTDGRWNSCCKGNEGAGDYIFDNHTNANLEQPSCLLRELSAPVACQ